MTLVDTIATAMMQREREDGMEPFHPDYYTYLAETAVDAYDAYRARTQRQRHYPASPGA